MKKFQVKNIELKLKPLTLLVRKNVQTIFKRVKKNNESDSLSIAINLFNDLDENLLTNKLVVAIAECTNQKMTDQELENFLDECTYEEFQPEEIINVFFLENKKFMEKLILYLLNFENVKKALQTNSQENSMTIPTTTSEPIESTPKNN